MKEFDTKTLKTVGIWAIIAIIAMVLIIIAIKLGKKFLNNELTEKQIEHINELEIDETEVTLPGSSIQNLVAKLKTAFGSWGWATDEDAVYEVFESLTSRSDLLTLISKFGVYEDHTLGEWMTRELNASELEHVTNILSSKGIVYEF